MANTKRLEMDCTYNYLVRIQFYMYSYLNIYDSKTF